MVTDDLPDSFEQLVAFGRRPDVKIRPVLLRVLVDMFVGKSHHNAAALQQFEEMMLHLLDDADDETRLAVAEKLSVDPHTPRGLLERFLAERGAIAAKVLARAPMDAGSLNAAAVFGTAAMALAVAGRADLDPTIARSLAQRPEPEVLRALVENVSAPLERSLFRYLVRRAQGLPGLATSLFERDEPSAEATSLFLSAGPRQRAALILAARRQHLGAVGAPAAIAPELAAAIARAAITEGLEGLDSALAAALGVSAFEMQRLIDDRHGEPLALALAAVGAPVEVATRVFILGDPRIGHSFAKVKALVGIVEAVPARAARQLVTSMLGHAHDMPREAFPATSPDPHARRDRDAARFDPVTAAPAGRRQPAIWGTAQG